jgi:hypothetical protein
VSRPGLRQALACPSLLARRAVEASGIGWGSAPYHTIGHADRVSRAAKAESSQIVMNTRLYPMPFKLVQRGLQVSPGGVVIVVVPLVLHGE